MPRTLIFALLVFALELTAAPGARAQGTPGLTDGGVEVGVILPSNGPLAETGASLRAVLAAFFEEVNARGGVHNRKVTLRFFDTPAAARQATVFAYVGGITAGADAELLRLAREEEVPVVGPSTLATEAGTPPNPRAAAHGARRALRIRDRRHAASNLRPQPEGRGGRRLRGDDRPGEEGVRAFERVG